MCDRVVDGCNRKETSMTHKTLFSKIIDREIPATIIYEDDQAIAIEDINPAAPHHFLVIPKKAIGGISETTETDAPLLGHLMVVAAKIAKQVGLEPNGYRLVINNGRDAGEAVPHLHAHLLGGRPMAWPPG